jgi:hypothetical protein
VARVTPAAPPREAPSLTDLATRVTRPINAGGVVSATLWPPEIGVRVPGIAPAAVDGSNPPEAPTAPPAPPGSPEWLLARLQAPTEHAELVFADVVPPELRAMLSQRRGEN